MQLLLDQDNAHLPLPLIGRTQLPDVVSALYEVHPDRRGDAIGEMWLAHKAELDVAKSLRSWWRRERNTSRVLNRHAEPGSLPESVLAKASIPARKL